MELKINKEYVLKTAEEILKFDSPTGFCFDIVDLIEKKVNEFGYKLTRTNKGCAVIEVPGKNSEKTIKENVTIPAIDTIVYHGVKNPIADGVPFLQRPSRGIITSNYGRRYGATHHGIDIAACYGSNIGAALDGVVNETGYNSVYGYYVKVNHGGGIETLYGHSSKILVQKGDVIKKGDTIALVGSTGNSTGPHIHFELRTNGVAINPAKYIM